MSWGSPVEVERRRRILIALWAYAYEFANDSLVDDFTFDRESYLVDLSIDTGNELLDSFFKREFHPCTGQWIHKHPEQDKLAAIYRRLKESNEDSRAD